MEKCLNCGKEIDNDVKFCEFCGEKQVEKKMVKNKKKGFIIGISILILVVIGGFGYNYYQETIAENSVAHLFDSNQVLNEEITKEDIENATKKADHVFDSELKSKLTIDLQAATNMLAVVKISKEVLVDDDILIEEISNLELESFSENLEKVKTYSPVFYEKYTKIYSTAQQQYELNTNLEKEIESVFNDGNIQEDITREEYDNLVSMNESVKNVTVKELFSEKLNEVEEFIKKVEEKEIKDTADLPESINSRNNENRSDEVSKETVETTLEHTPSSFIGAWTTSNLVVKISEEEIAIGVQGSDNGVFGEITNQSFDSTTDILNVSIVSLANSFMGTTQDEYFDFAFKLKEVNGEMYIEYDGEDYIRNDAF